MAPTLPRDPVKELVDSFVSEPLTLENQSRPVEFKTAAQLSLAAFKAARSAQKELDTARLRAISEAEAKKSGRDPLTAAYLRSLPDREQKKLLRMKSRPFQRAIRQLARRAHALHDSGAFNPDDFPPRAAGGKTAS